MGLSKGQSISGQGAYWPKVDSEARVGGESRPASCVRAFSFGTTIVEVKVDPETGQVEVLEAWASQDVGRALNPKVIESQFEGGWRWVARAACSPSTTSLTEGRVLNPTQLEYRLPLACDMPKINSIIVESNDPNGPYGAKEAGMSVAMSAAQAYVGAICNAMGT